MGNAAQVAFGPLGKGDLVEYASLLVYESGAITNEVTFALCPDRREAGDLFDGSVDLVTAGLGLSIPLPIVAAIGPHQGFDFPLWLRMREAYRWLICRVDAPFSTVELAVMLQIRRKD
jgi:hypothetical protein